MFIYIEEPNKRELLRTLLSTNGMKEQKLMSVHDALDGIDYKFNEYELDITITYRGIIQLSEYLNGVNLVINDGETVIEIYDFVEVGGKKYLKGRQEIDDEPGKYGNVFFEVDLLKRIDYKVEPILPIGPRTLEEIGIKI